MGGHQQRRSVLALCTHQSLDSELPMPGVLSARGFIEHQECRLASQRLRQGNPLRLP
jgi:hypothetical protein